MQNSLRSVLRYVIPSVSALVLFLLIAFFWRLHEGGVSDIAAAQAHEDLEVALFVPPGRSHEPVIFSNWEKTATYEIASVLFAARHSADRPFTKKEGQELGLVRGFRHGVRDYPDPFWIGRGTASGDFNHDGWQDIAFGSDAGPVVYANRGGWFEMVDVPQELLKYRTYAVAFVDMDNDGWQDFYFTTFNKGNYLIRNEHGHFAWSKPIKVPNGSGILTVSPAFGDMDKDGFLDVVNGNMALGVVTGSQAYSGPREDTVTWNQALSFTEQRLPAFTGETMSSHVADLNDDGYLDILFGNDFIFPDDFVLGGKGREWKAMKNSDHFVAATPIYSMGLDTGDVDNDLRLDFVTTGTLEKAKWVGTAPIDGVSPDVYGAPKWTVETCHGVKDPITRSNCERVRGSDHMRWFDPEKELKVSDCLHLEKTVDKQGCLLSLNWLLLTHPQLFPDCSALKEDGLVQEVCTLISRKGRDLASTEFPDSIPQQDTGFLYLGQKDGKFTDINAKSPRAFVHPGGWTWATRIVDLDNDGWQDVFNSEGVVRKGDYGFNAFMKNIGGKKFEQRQFSYNLVDDFGLYSFTLVDFDNDGDLDIIGNSAEGPVQVYINNENSNRTIAVSLEDPFFNRDAIGARIYITYAGGAQMRELKASGGYQSFDAPIAYFGLGQVQKIESIKVRWLDGGETTVRGDLAANRHYRIKRLSK